MIRATFLLIGLTGFAGAALACDISPRESGRIAAVIDPVSFELADGRELRLEGLGPPRAPSRHNGPWPYLGDATAEVSDLVDDGALTFAATEAPDRYGRIIAQVWLENGTWLNGALARQGLARVETTADQRRCAAEALRLEADARAARRGMWRLSAYEVRDAMEAGAFTNDFQILEGRIAETAEVRGRIFLNFGTDWRTDFTVTIAPGDARKFAEAGRDPLSWAGRAIRVRGWLEWYNGPMIEASHPEQIELLDSSEAEGG
jgi:endonuclease YncB( thermonuclease family)